MNELKNRGVKDVLIICADGLTGIKEAIAAAFPKTEYQRCIVHQVRNTALFEELLKKSVKSILGRYLCGRNNPKITHRFLCECYKINNYNLGM